MKPSLLDRSLVKVLIALAFMATGLVLAGAGIAVLLKPPLSVGVGFIGDQFMINGTIPSILVACLGILATISFISADRLDSYLPIRAAAIGLVVAGGYGFAETTQWRAFGAAAFLLAVTWVDRITPSANRLRIQARHTTLPDAD